MAGVHTDARSGVQLWPEGGHNQPLAVGAGTGFHTTEREMAGVHTDARSGVHAGLDTVARAQPLAASTGTHRKGERVRGHHRRKVRVPTRAQ